MVGVAQTTDILRNKSKSIPRNASPIDVASRNQPLKMNSLATKINGDCYILPGGTAVLNSKQTQGFGANQTQMHNPMRKFHDQSVKAFGDTTGGLAGLNAFAPGRRKDKTIKP